MCRSAAVEKGGKIVAANSTSATDSDRRKVAPLDQAVHGPFADVENPGGLLDSVDLECVGCCGRMNKHRPLHHVDVPVAIIGSPSLLAAGQTIDLLRRL